jgi:putative serine protease PepD
MSEHHTEPETFQSGYPYASATATLPMPPAPPSDPTPPFGSAPEGPPQKHRRGPGWGGTVAIGAAAAVLASALTAGGVAIFDRNSNPPAATSTAQSSGSAPLNLGSGSNVNWTGVSAKVAPSVVAVSVALGNGSGDQGSGIVLDKQGHVLTNNHVISSAGNGGSITVELSNGKIYDATVVGTDPSTDLAVLKLSNPPSNLTPATFADSTKVSVGDAVMAIGNPLGLSDTATTGIVSALNRPVTTTVEQNNQQQQQNPFGNGALQQQQPAEQVVTNAIQTDAAVNPGNSGGALVNSAGQVIGVTSSIASLDSGGSGQSGSIGLGFAIPSNEATDVANQLIAGGTVKHAYLGVTIGDGTASVGGAKQNAAIVGAVQNGTPAANAGLKANDAIIAINGQDVASADSLIGQIRALDPGTKVSLTVVRGGQTQNLTVTLGTAPASNN